jgi:transcriptional regulator with XRE-family HTH domain
MDMKIDGNRVRALREDRAWSQEHLAEVTGLSVRTIQRIETDGNASAESRLALAAAFAVMLADLAPPPVATTEPAAPVSVRRKRGSGRHALAYLVICGGLLLLDWRGNGAIDWAYWPILGWGIGLAMSSWRVKIAGPGEAQAGE